MYCTFLVSYYAALCGITLYVCVIRHWVLLLFVSYCIYVYIKLKTYGILRAVYYEILVQDPSLRDQTTL